MRLVPERSGWIEVVCGPMFSGKSEEMIRRMRRAEIAGQRVGVFKPAIDARYDAHDVVSHAGSRFAARPVAGVADLVALAGELDVIGVDEAQFFAFDLVPAVQALADEGRRVVLAGLDRDFRGLPFGPMPALLAVADFVDKIQAVCHGCGGPGTMTQRLVDGRPAPFDGATVVVGAIDQYEARCRACYEPDPAIGGPLAADGSRVAAGIR